MSAIPPSPAPEPETPRGRTLNRNGGYNIERRGVPHQRLTYDAYHHLVGLAWHLLIAYVTLAYLAINAAFALLYLAVGDGIENARHGSFEDAFFFSVQTMATIGYGKLTPHGFMGNFLVTLESIIGIAIAAVLTGLLFAKFSRPTSRVVFSRSAVVTRQNGVPVLIFRLANERDSMIVEARMRLLLMRNERTIEGTMLRRFHDLQLARSETAIFPLSWTVTHPIDEKSPLYGLSAADWQRESIEIICAFTGTEELLSQTIHARFSYVLEDVRFAHRFVDIISIAPNGHRVVDYAHFHDVEPDGLSA